MSDDLIKRLEARKTCIGFKSRPSEDGDHMVCSAQYGSDPLTTEAAAALIEAQATISRQQVMLDRALESSADMMIELNKALAEIERLRTLLSEASDLLDAWVDPTFSNLEDAQRHLDTRLRILAEIARHSKRVVVSVGAGGGG